MSSRFPIGSDPNNFVMAMSSVMGLCLGVCATFGPSAQVKGQMKVRLYQIEEERNSREIEALQILKSASKKSGDGGGYTDGRSKNLKLAGKTDC